ncbi:MAG: hypothetical protein D3911_08080 [Candidatus Electrothrix sp. AW3_4]|nr:hypothetical protein [Candidatus Electrothrix gigas]
MKWFVNGEAELQEQGVPSWSLGTRKKNIQRIYAMFTTITKIAWEKGTDLFNPKENNLSP